MATLNNQRVYSISSLILTGMILAMDFSIGDMLPFSDGELLLIFLISPLKIYGILNYRYYNVLSLNHEG